MIHDLKPYPAYKDSGVPWLGKVPEHWIELRIKNLFREKDERSGDGNGVLLSLTRARGIIPQTEASNRIASAEDLSKYKVCRPSDLIMNRMQAWSGMFAVSSYNGLVSPDYSVFAAIGKLDVKYFEHLFKTPILVEQFAQRSKGIGSGFNRLYTPDFGAVSLVIPPLFEQSAIVRYLDHFDQRIRHYIHAKKKLIKLLEEQKQAIIHQAVTRGLDPTVRLKPSGVEWLGDIPEHWQITRLSRLTIKIGDGLHGTPEYVDESPYYFINGNNLSNGSIKVVSSTRCVSADEFQKHKIALDESTLLLSINGTIGNVALYRGEPIILGKSAAYINCRNALSRDYLLYFLQSGAVGNFFRLEITGTTIFNLSLESIRNLPVALLPLTEQLKISSFLDLRTVEFNELIERVNLEISLLREYRTRLIADVVTGKLDVREAAANLPEETDETEVLEDEFAGDEETAEEELESEPEEE